MIVPFGWQLFATYYNVFYRKAAQRKTPPENRRGLDRSRSDL